MKVPKMLLGSKTKLAFFLLGLVGWSVLFTVMGLLCKFVETVSEKLAPIVPYSSAMLDYGLVGLFVGTAGLFAEGNKKPSFSEVEKAIQRFKSSSYSPALYQTIRYTLVAMLMFVVAWALGLLQISEAALLTFVVAFVRYISSDRPDTWEEYINYLLLSYDPVDRPEFVLLQRATRQNRGLTACGLNSWVTAESAMIARKCPLDKATDKRAVRLTFVDRDV